MTKEEKIFRVLAVLERICPRLEFLPIEEIKKRVSDEWLDYYVWYFYGRIEKMDKSFNIEDTGENGLTKLKTIGKLLDNKVCIEGMVTICLRCMSEDGRHFFRIHTDGSDITKSPEDMFEI